MNIANSGNKGLGSLRAIIQYIRNAKLAVSGCLGYFIQFYLLFINLLFL